MSKGNSNAKLGARTHMFGRLLERPALTTSVQGPVTQASIFIDLLWRPPGAQALTIAAQHAHAPAGSTVVRRAGSGKQRSCTSSGMWEVYRPGLRQVCAWSSSSKPASQSPSPANRPRTEYCFPHKATSRSALYSLKPQQGLALPPHADHFDILPSTNSSDGFRIILTPSSSLSRTPHQTFAGTTNRPGGRSQV